MIVDLRLVAPATACWLAAGVLVAAPDLAASLATACWVIALVAVAVLASMARRPAGPAWRAVAGALCLCCAAVGLVAAMVGAAAPARVPPILVAASEGHAVVHIAATVWSVPSPSASGLRAGVAGTSRVRFRATMVSLGTRGDDESVNVPIVVFAPAAAEGFASSVAEIGSTVALVGTLRLTAPGDAASALFFSETRASMIAEPPLFLSWANGLRSGFSQAARELPGDGADLLPGLAIGDTSAVSPELDNLMKASSLSHLTAVSGANCAIVIAAIMLLAARLGLRRRWRIALALCGLAGFAVLVTPEPSVLRSSVMASVTLLALGAGRPGRGIPTLALSVVVLLVTDPWLARNYGFALSVAATGGLLVLAGPLGRALGQWMPRWLAGAIAIPCAAQLACQPVLLMLNPSLSLYGVPANLLAAPAAPLATVIGLVGCLLLPVLPGVATGLIDVAWVPSVWIAAVAKTTAALPGNRLPWLPGTLGVAVLTILTVIACAVLLRRGDGVRPRWANVGLVVLLTCAGGYTGILAGTGIGRHVAFPQDWQFAACDIGQGDAVVVRDGDHFGLVDVGPDPALLEHCLATLGITRLDLLVLTHYDLDHVGGLDAVIGMVDTALVGRPENSQDAELHDQLAAGGATVRQSAQGDTGTLGALDWSILWPERNSARMQTGNPGSVTIEFAGRGVRSIFLGDLGEVAQQALLAASPPGRVDVVKVAHHGSADQSEQLYAALGARVGLVSVGADNGYGHPTQRLLDILTRVGTRIERTDLQGMVVVSASADGTLAVWSEREVADDRVSRAGVRRSG